MTRWVERPDRPPHRCAVTLRGQDETGPFLDLGLDYFTPINEGGKLGVSPRLQRLYLCARAIREACERPGSPYVTMPRDQFEAIESGSERLAAELEAAEERIAELEAELAQRPAPRVMNQEDLEEFLAAMDSRYARKTGPKPKGRAA